MRISLVLTLSTIAGAVFRPASGGSDLRVFRRNTLQALITKQELPLIRECRSKLDPLPRRGVIQDYARLMHMSEGRAEDALDLWVHLLAESVPMDCSASSTLPTDGVNGANGQGLGFGTDAGTTAGGDVDS